MSVKSLFVVLLSLVPLKLWANVTFQTDGCQMEIPVELSGEEPETSSSISIVLESSLKKVAKIQWNAPVGAEFSKAQISWPEVDFVDSRGEIFFSPAYHDRLRESILTPYELLKKEGAVFEAPFWGFARVQSFFTLLHSQESFLLELLNNDGEVQQSVEVSLRGSDLAFRNIAHLCFPLKSQSYLEGVTRKQGVGLSWENSYGVLDYDLIQSFSRELFLRTMNGQDFEALSSILNRFSQLNQDQQSLESSSYSAFLNQLDPLASRLNVVKDSIQSLQGRGGELASLDLKIKNASEEIENLRAQIQVVQGENAQLEQRLQSSTEEFSELSISLALIDAEMSSVRRQLIEASEKLQDLTHLSSHELVGDYVTSQSAVSGVDQFTKVFDQVTAIEMNEQRKEQGLEVAQMAETLQEELDGLTQIHSTLMDQRRALMSIRSQITQAQGELRDQLDVLDILNGQYYGLSFETLQPLLAQERESLSEPSKIFEAQVFVAEVRQSYEIYDNKLLEVGRELNNSELLSHLVCSTESLKNDFMGSCLDPRHLENQARVEDYLNGLSSADLERLGEWLGQSQSVFNQQNFKEEIALEWAILVSLIPVDELIQKWEAVLYARWKFFKARDLKFNQVSLDSLEEVLLQIRDEISLKEEAIGSRQADIVGLETRFQLQSRSFEQQEEHFFSSASAVYSRILSQIQSLPTSHFQCFTRESLPLNCRESLASVGETIRLNQEALNEEREQLIASLQSSYMATFSYLTQTLEETRQRQQEVSTQRQNFIQTHDLRAKESLLETLRHQKEEITQELENLMAQKEQQAELLESSTAMQSHRQKYLVRFLIERAQLIQEIVPLENQLADYCEEISGLEERWEELIEQSQQDLQLNDVKPSSLRQLRQRCQLSL